MLHGTRYYCLQNGPDIAKWFKFPSTHCSVLRILDRFSLCTFMCKLRVVTWNAILLREALLYFCAILFWWYCYLNTHVPVMSSGPSGVSGSGGIQLSLIDLLAESGGCLWHLLIFL